MQQFIDNITEKENSTDELHVAEFEVDDWFESAQYSRKAATIKAASPFTVFLEIEFASKIGVSNTLNLLYNTDYIQFLQYHFMPYIFIWSGFVYRQMDGANITRLSQGVIEKHFGTKRREIPKPIVPNRYILSSLKTALADCAILESCNKMVKIRMRVISRADYFYNYYFIFLLFKQ
jgi:hypothetical protein